jgi:rhodanese-related sulfurtransferase
MKSIDAAELANWLADEARAPPLLLDVREPWEQQICTIAGSQSMPMRQIPAAFSTLDPDQAIVCVCHHGGRSAQVAMFLQRQGYEDVYNLTGGVDAWARQVDQSMSVY